jgi:hypothetical protein
MNNTKKTPIFQAAHIKTVEEYDKIKEARLKQIDHIVSFFSKGVEISSEIRGVAGGQSPEFMYKSTLLMVEKLKDVVKLSDASGWNEISEMVFYTILSIYRPELGSMIQPMMLKLISHIHKEDIVSKTNIVKNIS